MMYDVRFTTYDWGGRISAWPIFLWLLIFFGCKKEAPVKIAPAFYHWKTRLQLSENERLYLDSLGVKKLYVKFFDVDWDEAAGQPVPLASVEIDTTNLHDLEIAPTIFLTNRTLLHLSMPEVDTLAGRIFEKINAVTAIQPFNHSAIQEIQFDCDWTETTRDRFFTLLTQFRKKLQVPAASRVTNHQSPITLTATIRLHQFKFFEKTGVPPVDRGMLMCYNTGYVEAWDTENSILDVAAARRYFPPGSFEKYPLPLDVALPLFRWGVLFRDGE